MVPCASAADVAPDVHLVHDFSGGVEFSERVLGAHGEALVPSLICNSIKRVEKPVAPGCLIFSIGSSDVQTNQFKYSCQMFLIELCPCILSSHREQSQDEGQHSPALTTGWHPLAR